MSKTIIEGTPTTPVALQPTWRDWLRYYKTTLTVLVVSIVIYLATLLVIPGFATLSHFLYSLQLAGFLGIVAAGEAIVILTSGIDLSIAYIISGVAILVSSLLAQGHLPIPVIIVIGLIVAAVIGAINGIGVAVFRIPSLVMTLAVGSIIEGIQLIATGGSPKSGSPALLVAIANKNLGQGLTGTVIVWFIVVIVIIWLLNLTRAGRQLYAVGTNERVAQLSGVSVVRVTILAYIISGLTAGIAGCLLLGYTGISISTMGESYLLPAVAAVVLGGASILGGKGGAVGTALGAFLLTVVVSLLTVIQLSPADRETLQGVILLVVVILYNLRSAFSTHH
jgi:ribose transport system permease protein